MGLVKIITEVGKKIQNAESHGTILGPNLGTSPSLMDRILLMLMCEGKCGTDGSFCWH
jgi:hypothetical protein